MNSNYMKPKVATSRNGVYESELYHSNLFKLQVDDLLKSVSVGQGKLSRLIERDLRDLKKIIEQTEDRPPRTVSGVSSKNFRKLTERLRYQRQNKISKKPAVLSYRFPSPIPMQMLSTNLNSSRRLL